MTSLVMSWQAIRYKQPIPPSAAPRISFFSPLIMSPARTAAPPKNTSKMSKGAIVQLYNSAATENEELAKKYGLYPRVSRGEAG
jgi:hypothetical protein